MHVEIQVALNFLISFLYNKLPRRRVNQFGEELDAALKIKFEGHWYPEKPYKGSAFRCVKTTPPLDPVFDIAAREAGMDIADIQENLPQELSIWIDPGEVSYRMSEKGPVKILYTELDRSGHDCENSGREVARAFNPEAQCFKPVEVLSNQLVGMSLNGHGPLPPPAHPQPTSAPLFAPQQQQPQQPTNSFKAPGSSNHNHHIQSVTYTPKSSNPVTFTTAAFAQTKFGSTKLKTNSKRSQRMSPTEFSNYIKQRAILQQQANQSQAPLIPGGHRMSADGLMLFGSNVSPQNSRSISPEQSPLDNFMPMQSSSSGSSLASSVSSSGSLFGASQFNMPSPTSSSPPFSASSSSAFEATSYLADFLGGGTDNNKYSLGSNGIGANGSTSMAHQQHDNTNKQGNNALNRIATFLDHTGPYVTTVNHGGGMGIGPSATSSGPQQQQIGDQVQGSNNGSAKAAFDNLNMSMNGVTYQNQYQHLLVAN